MPSETPEPTQEQARAYGAQLAFERALNEKDGAEGAIIAAYAAAEAAPLREEIERLTKERDEYRLDALPAKSLELEIERRRVKTAEAKVLSLEAEIEKLAARTGELHREKTNAETEIGRLLNLWNEATTALREERLQATDANPLPLNHAFERVRVLALEAVTGAAGTSEIGKLALALEHAKRGRLTEAWCSACQDGILIDPFVCGYCAHLSDEEREEKRAECEPDLAALPLSDRQKVLILEKQLSDALAAASRAREEQVALRAALEAARKAIEKASPPCPPCDLSQSGQDCNCLDYLALMAQIDRALAPAAQRDVIARWEALHEGHSIDCEEQHHAAGGADAKCVCGKAGRR